MKRIDLAGYVLIACAFVLAGLLAVSLQGRMTPSANAELVVSKDSLTLMTARTRSNEESVLVLDNASERLMVYSVDVPRNRIDLAGSLDLRREFARVFEGGAGGGGSSGGSSGGGR
jgi:uncharacterized membrane protein YgcG